MSAAHADTAPDGKTGAATADRVAVIIPHYNDVARLGRCLDALLKRGTPEGVSVVVVDNASTEDVAAVVRPHEGVALVIEPERGAAAARNRGVRDTRAPILAFLDADCVPSETWLSDVLAVHDRSDIVGGQVEVFCETAPPRSGAEAFETVLAFNQARYIEEVGFTVTANMVTRRDVFDHVGGFSNGVSEDLDWCQRARALGYEITFAPELLVSHPARVDWRALRSKWRRLTQEAFALHRQNGGSPVRWGVRGAAVLASPLKDVPAFVGSKELSVGERAKGMATLVAIRLRRSLWMVRQAFGREIK